MDDIAIKMCVMLKSTLKTSLEMVDALLFEN